MLSVSNVRLYMLYLHLCTYIQLICMVRYGVGYSRWGRVVVVGVRFSCGSGWLWGLKAVEANDADSGGTVVEGNC